MIRIFFIYITIFFTTLINCGPVSADNELRQKAQKTYNENNYQDAFELFEKLCLAPDTDPQQVGNDLNMAITCLANINRTEEIDSFREKIIKLHRNNWRLLLAAAQNYAHFKNYGYLIAGEFYRGHHRGGGKYVNSNERDRVRALQLMEQAALINKDESSASEIANFYFSFADILFKDRSRGSTWRLQYLTDLSSLPDYDEGYSHQATQVKAPVDDKGNPIFHKLPVSWESSKSDGERWRWVAKAAETDAGYKNTVLQRFADFLYSQFGVHTMASFSSRYKGMSNSSPDTDNDTHTGTYDLHTLEENETIACLASGIKRFNLPDEFNYIRIFKEIGNNSILAQIFENRRQYDKSARFWEKSGNKTKVEQITGNWGVFEPVMTQAPGKGAIVDYRFRNGRTVQFEAWPIKVQKLLKGIKRYIKSNPRNMSHNRVYPASIGYRIVYEKETDYLAPSIAKWSMDLSPSARHFDKRITITTPLQKSGAYLLKAEMENGNTSRIIIWIDDTVIVKKPLNESMMYYVADAVTGEPVANANLELFGFNREWRNKFFGYRTHISDFAEFTNEDGQVILSDKSTDSYRLSHKMQWLAIATTPKGRLAWLGFNNVWYSTIYDREYNQVKVFAITDRPVYRPEQTIKFKAWIRRAQYDMEDNSEFAGNSFIVRINNGQGEKIFEKQLIADKWGGVSGEYKLPEDAGLGMYRIYLPGDGGGQFRVEEYKKPEFEVKVEAPEKPVSLGDTVKAKITARYYFGAPVTHAKVKYKVLRYSHTAQWYAPGTWDWFYGTGYKWLAYDYAWYPGWSDWGCRSPFPWWWNRPSPPPEVVMENETKIGPDGIVNISIDTQAAKELHGDTDHKYEITAEVTDLSRRTITGQGSVLAARKPFTVYVTTDQGYYRTGDTVTAHFNTRTSDGKPVKGTGQAKLFKISYDSDNRPIETLVQTWDVNTGTEGTTNLQIKAAESGQYRLSCTITDSEGHMVEGAYLFVIRGTGFKSAEFRFNDLELIPEKSDYAPGDTLRLMINTNRTNSDVLLFLRPANGVYLAPKLLHMTGKSIIEDIEIVKKDMPNFFIEALTVSNGKVHTEIREIIVPPQKKVLNMEVLPSLERYKPGEKAEIQIKLSDFFGKPFIGSTVMTVYDKSVEYIYGGSNIPEIKAFFWKWRRHHTPNTESSLNRTFHNLLKKNETSMQHLGVFGHLVADELGGKKQDQDDFRQKNEIGDARTEAKLSMAMDMAAPPPAPAMKPQTPNREMADQNVPSLPDPDKLQQPAIRSNFADTAFWADSVTTDENGIANISFTMPENLTGWKIKAWTMGHGTKVGEGSAGIVTAKNLMVRLQAPRFFIQKDEVVLSANIHNYLSTSKQVKAILELDGPCLKLLEAPEKIINVEPDSETRMDWRVSVLEAGEAVIRIKALTDEESDAMEMRFPVYVHGMDKTVPFCGVIRPEQERAEISMNVPAQRRPEASKLEIRYSPTLAGAMVDALPYLADYPYGCTEQTLNRFIPTVITRNVLKKLGINLKNIQENQHQLIFPLLF